MNSTTPRTSLLIAITAIAGCASTTSGLFSDPDAGEALRVEIARNPASDAASIHGVVTAYLAANGGRFACSRSEFWLTTEQTTWTTPDGRDVPVCYDRARELIPPGYAHEILRIQAVSGHDTPQYRVTVRFAPGASVPASFTRRYLVTYFAEGENGEWKLGGALPRLTRGWRRETIGPFTYIVSPKHRFSRQQALDAARFADSVAVLLGVPPIRALDYYIVESGDAMLRIQGLVSDTVHGMPGGRAMPGVIISGDPAFGEFHGHEIVHHLMQPLQGPMHVAASEGVPSWLGGTRGMRYPEARGALRAFLADNPAATVDTLLASNAHPMFNPAAALLAEMVFERGGAGAIRRFLHCGPSLSEFKDGVAEILNMTWAATGADWKRRALNGTQAPQ